MNQILIKTKKRRFKTSPDLHGVFFEDINRVGDGGLYPEMLRNRSFEDSIVPKDCKLVEDGKYFITPTGYKCAFNNGEGLDQWYDSVPETKIPAWYVSEGSSAIDVSLDEEDTLNENREASLIISFKEENSSHSVYNIGYTGMNVEEDKKYNFFMFAKATEGNQRVELSLRSKCGSRIYDSKSIEVSQGEFKRYDCVFTSKGSDVEATFHISSKDKGTVKLGFSSLMPVETYKGRVNGLRKDLVELLKGMKPSFLRFPGGCIVEGLTKETTMTFEKTIGPVWERPSHWLIWFYRTTNGLGFHEYLQLCEDIGANPMYVINCGMTCQHRKAEFFDDELTDEYLQDAINALEYANAPADSYWGRKRAENGHPEPFNIKYVEIGNENYGEEYNRRYELFYRELKKRFPDIIYISNTHTELEGLPTEVVDEHFYNDTEFFATQQNMYDDYDRKGPKIFLGEYGVTNNRVNASLYSALGEAVFLTGLEHNQDLVTMSCFAPLFLNASYKSWYPNLIEFNNRESFGIPSYYMLQMMGENRGDYVVESSTKTDTIMEDKFGWVGLYAKGAGTSFTNVTIDDIRENTIVSNISGEFIVEDDKFLAKTDDSWCLLGDEDAREYVVSADVEFGKAGEAIKISVWNERKENVGDVYQTYWGEKRLQYYSWVIEDGKSYIEAVKRLRVMETSEKVDVDIDYSKANNMKIVAKDYRIECYLNGELVNTYAIEPMPKISSVVTVDDETNEAIIKIVNMSDKNEEVEIKIDEEVNSIARVQILESDDKYDVNSFEDKTKVSPKEFTLDNLSSEFIYDAPKHSFSIIRVGLC